MSVSGGDASHAIMLFLISEAALQDRGTQIADYAAGGRYAYRLILGLATLADEVGDDSVFGTVAAVLIIGIDCVHADARDTDSGQ